MQRTLLIAMTTAVVAAGIAATATILVSSDDDVAVTSPTATSPTATRTTPEPAGTAQPASAPIRSAASIECSKEPEFCSDTTGAMEVSEQRLDAWSSSPRNGDERDALSIRMRSKVFRSDDEEATKGDAVEMLRVDVTVRNDGEGTFVFPKREIVLEVTRDGRLYERLRTEGEGFEMSPGGEMRGKFEQPITEDGSYIWEAKTWYRPK